MYDPSMAKLDCNAFNITLIHHNIRLADGKFKNPEIWISTSLTIVHSEEQKLQNLQFKLTFNTVIWQKSISVFSFPGNHTSLTTTT